VARDLVAEITRLSERLARAEGRREAAAARLAQVSATVAAAKGRLAIREPVEACLDELQAEANRRNVARFEALLTALVREVLPGEKPVALTLSTERGLPALDIGLTRPDGGREDVLEDNGGALTNVVSMALRLIAVVKAGVGRFLALDEADCWIAPERVPAFYRVLEDSAARLGVQCLAISHHDVAAFGGGMQVSRISGHPADGVGIEGPAAACAAAWTPEMPGFRHLRLVDVQGFADATLPLSPGLNALTGPNNRGKSTVVRALRAVFYGEARDSLVRAGAAAARVEIGVAGGRTLRFVRQPRRTPVNLWSLHEADGRLVEANGTRLETGGRTVPAWVERLFGIRRVEDLDVHVAHQKFPVFLLGEPPAKRSAVLAIGQEGAYLRDMQAIHREGVTRDLQRVREGEREVATLREQLAAFADLAPLAADIARARTAAAALAEGEAATAALAARARALADLRDRLADARTRADALVDLPAPAALDALALELERARRRAEAARQLLATARAGAAARGRAAALAGLPAELPRVVPAPGLAALAEIEDRAARLAQARARAAQAAQALADTEREADALVAETGGRCPACGTPVAGRTLLAHDHPPRPRAA
jgi:hypothetical protein